MALSSDVPQTPSRDPKIAPPDDVSDALTPPPVNADLKKEASAEKNKALASETNPKTKTNWWVWLIVLLLVIAMGWALYYLNQTIDIVPQKVHRSITNGLSSAKAWTSKQFEKKKPSDTSNNLGENMAAKPQKDKINKSSETILKRPITKTKQVAAEIKAIREEASIEPAANLPLEKTAAKSTSTPQNANRRFDAKTVSPSQSATAVSTDFVTAEKLAEPAKKDVVWPDIVISGIVGKGKRGAAIINNELVMVGEKNDAGVILDKLEAQSAVLEFEGQKRRFGIKTRK